MLPRRLTHPFRHPSTRMQTALDYSVCGYNREPALAALLLEKCLSCGRDPYRPSLVWRALSWGNVALVHVLTQRLGLQPSLDTPEGQQVLYGVLCARKVGAHQGRSIS